MAPSTTAFLAAGAAPIGGRVSAAAAATCRSPLGVSAFTPARTAAAAPPPPPASFLAPMTALMPGFPTSDTDKGLRVGVIRTRWGGEMVDALHEQVVAGLTEAGLEGESVVEMTVPGAFEVPMAARLMGLAQKVDAIVVVGLLVQGETGHYEYISKAVTGALMEVSRVGRAAGVSDFGWMSRGGRASGLGMPMPSLLTCWLSTALLLRLVLMLFCFPPCFFAHLSPCIYSCNSSHLSPLSMASSRARRRSKRRSGQPTPSRRPRPGQRRRWRWAASDRPRLVPNPGRPTRSRRSAFSRHAVLGVGAGGSGDDSCSGAGCGRFSVSGLITVVGAMGRAMPRAVYIDETLPDQQTSPTHAYASS